MKTVKKIVNVSFGKRCFFPRGKGALRPENSLLVRGMTLFLMLFFFTAPPTLADTPSLTGVWHQISATVACAYPWYVTEDEASGVFTGTIDTSCHNCPSFSIIGYRQGDHIPVLKKKAAGTTCTCAPYWDCGPLTVSPDGNYITGPCRLPKCDSVQNIVVERQTDPSYIKVSPAGNDFGYVAPGADGISQSFAVTNVAPTGSGTDLAISAVTLAGTDKSDFGLLSDNCSNTTLSPGETCTIVAAFAPISMSAGKKEARLTVNSDDPAVPVFPVMLHGGMHMPSTLTPKGTPNAETTKDPIQTATGEFFIDPITDLSLGGPLPLEFKRYHAQGLAEDPLMDTTLKSWMHNFDIRLTTGDGAWDITDADFIYAVLFEGDAIPFLRVGTAWIMLDQKEKIYQLKQDTSGSFWLFVPDTLLVYLFDGDTGALEQIADKNGNTLELTYDGSGFLTQVSDGLGRTLSFSYDAPSADQIYKVLKEVTDGSRTVTYGLKNYAYLAKVWDAQGNLTTYENIYAGAYTRPKITQVVHPLGNHHYTQTYDYKDRVTVQTDAYGNTLGLEYDTPDDGITTLTDALGTTRQTIHSQQKIMTQREDNTGKSATFSYDGNGRRTGITDRLGDTTSVTYHAPTGKIKTVTNAAGHTITYNYAAQTLTYGGSVGFTAYLLSDVQYPDGTAQYFAHDTNGNIVKYKDQAGELTAYTYNSLGLMLTETLPGGGQTLFTYNADGTLATRTDSDTGTTVYTYDALKRPVTLTAPDGTAVSFTYDDNDRITAATNGNGITTQFTYDANGNLTARTDGAGNTAQFTYDLMDRLTGYTDESGHTTQTAYDELERISSVTGPDNITRSFDYNSRGWLTQTGRGGQTQTFTYDDEGVLSGVSSTLGATLGFQTNALGFVVKTTDTLGGTVTQTRDSMGRVTAVTDPLFQKTSFSYGSRGLLAGITLPDGRATAFTRNEQGLLQEISDLGGNPWTLDYTPMGRLKSLTDPLGNKTRYTYNTRGRLSNISYPDAGTLSRTYDDAGNPVQNLYSDGTDLEFTYDALGRLLSTDSLTLTRDETGRVTGTQSGQNTFNATYDSAGRLATVSYGNAMTVTYTYSPATGLLSKVADNLTNSWVTFTYNADSDLSGMGRSNGVDTQFSYDAHGRMTRIREGVFADIQYTLDAAGRVAQADMTVPLDPAPLISNATRSFSHDGAGHITTAGYAYDGRGRRTQAPGIVYTWDGASRLTGAGDVDLSYNGMGDIIKRTDAAGTTTRYHYNYALGLTPIVAETEDTGGQAQRYYVWTPDGVLLYAVDLQNANTVSFYHFDRTGATLALTDAKGDVTDAYTYSVYGQLLEHTGSTSQPFTFAGKWGIRQEDEEGTLYHVRARHYDAVTASFLSRDANWPDIFQPKDLNPYQYAGLDPATYTDVTGALKFDLTKIQKIAKPGIDSLENSATKYHGDDQGWWETAGNGIIAQIPGSEELLTTGAMIGTDDQLSMQDAAQYYAGGVTRDVVASPFTTGKFGIRLMVDLAWIHVGNHKYPEKYLGFWNEFAYQTAKGITESEYIIPGLIKTCDLVEEGYTKIGETALRTLSDTNAAFKTTADYVGESFFDYVDLASESTMLYVRGF